jgi:hypothetical protein
MKLHEVAKQLDPHAKIKKWLDNIEGDCDYTIRPNGVVDVNGDLDLSQVRDKILPVQFGKVLGRIAYGRASLTSLQGAPEYVKYDFSCWGTPIKSFSGVDKIVKHVGQTFLVSADATHLLGLLLIDGIKLIHCDGGPIDAILNKYIGTGDILSAQDELIDAGFIDQARL